MKSTAAKIKHLAIIPDGNRRWAKARGLQSWKGHLKAADATSEIIKAAFKLGIQYVTIWGGSYDNLSKRSQKEIWVLDRVYRRMAQKFIKDKETQAKRVRLRAIGEWPKLLKPATVKTLISTEETTKNYGDYNLTLLIGYNGDREMLAAVNKLIKKGEKATDESIKRELWTKELPPVDLIIRTGGEPHLSAGFMMWDIRYSQLYFTDKLWPDFTKKDLEKAVEYYTTLERRLGT